jgi:hypothetical protein
LKDKKSKKLKVESKAKTLATPRPYPRDFTGTSFSNRRKGNKKAA